MRQHNSITALGSAALDTIETPYGRADRIVGGSAFYVAAAAGLFAPVFLTSVVGDDFPMEEVAFLKTRGVRFDDLVVAKGKTFHWEGRYHKDINWRDTICTDVGVAGEFHPNLSVAARESQFLLLANIDPGLQLEVLGQIKSPKFVACDTMNLWIRNQRSLVDDLIHKTHLLVANDEEIALLSDGASLLDAGRSLLAMGPRWIVIKKGEHGAVLLGRDEPPFICPAFPLAKPCDPTGAGDSFVGAMVGYLAATGDLSAFNMRQAVVYGTITASFAVEDFGLGRLKSLTLEDVESRLREFRAMVEF